MEAAAAAGAGTPQDKAISIARGMPLAEEPGQGAHTLPGFLREVTTRYAGSEALVMHGPDGVERWTYDELWQRSTDIARALIAAGVGKDSRVGILMTNRPEFISAMFGTALAGGVCVALSTFSTEPELEYLLSVSDVSVLLFEDQVLKKDFGAMLADLEPALREAAPGTLYSQKFPFLRRLVRLPGVTAADPSTAVDCTAFESMADFLAAGSAVPVEVVEGRAASVKPSDTGGLFFSSGSTSLPKGILHSQRAFTIQWWRWPRLCRVDGPVRAWTGNGFFWSGNISIIVGSALGSGGAIVLQPLFEAESALELMQAEKVSMANGRPHQWARLQAADNWDSVDLSSLKYIFNGDLIKQHPTVTCDWQEPNSFGTTETMTILSSFDIRLQRSDYPGSFGTPLPGNVLKIIDPQTRAVMPLGERGELCIKGPTLMMGYVGKAAEETFDDEGYFCTGDGAYLDAEGHLYWEGRLNDIIKTGGANVSPKEVDTAISLYPGVKRSQTVGVPHDTLSEMVVSCVVPLEGEELDGKAIIDFLKQQLASFKVPREVLLFTEEEFPLTGNEKVKASDVKAMACKRLGIDT
ncbi:long-chain fatty acid--CoA ligase [Mangrovimicrobium sediminis]|uniref:Long-chain fatty acid--CoA ligase n=1 Tax=Mangrovimicrobium sediminis TaxID=2562682 RepID=A0A4Z0LVW9_9GAMM|nr:class I adenylate-forming enzyme family protein [Haliea sp. SAOS-164]TGD71327.1 long-chain fatty acid--CoA ligase [Haliea sp. SAOS-164]